jgi:hypothetical protein
MIGFMHIDILMIHYTYNKSVFKQAFKHTFKQQIMRNTVFITADLLRVMNNTDTKMDLTVLSPNIQHIFIII